MSELYIRRQYLKKNRTQNIYFVETWMNVVTVTSVEMIFFHAVPVLTFVNLLSWLPHNTFFWGNQLQVAGCTTEVLTASNRKTDNFFSQHWCLMKEHLKNSAKFREEFLFVN